MINTILQTLSLAVSLSSPVAFAEVEHACAMKIEDEAVPMTRVEFDSAVADCSSKFVATYVSRANGEWGFVFSSFEEYLSHMLNEIAPSI
jgi:hypothetical protein